MKRFTGIVLVLMFALGNLTLAAAMQRDTSLVHVPLATLGITQGQTARINMVNSPNPKSALPPLPITVEMCFHDSRGNPILDRSGLPVQKTVIINPHHGDFLDLNGNLVAPPGGRVVVIPCVRILSISEGSFAVPTLELYNNLIKTTFVLSPGTAKGFDPQPDPPAEVAFGLVGITPGVTARLYVHNSEKPNSTNPHEPVTVELTFHDANDRIIVDRNGREARKIVTLDPCWTNFLELNGNDIATPGSRVGIVPCVKVLRGSPGSLVTPTFEMYVNFNQQTLLLSNFQDPPDPVTPVLAR
jgi:hypothetical protein